MPTWNHLWFLPYLWCYSMVLGGMLLVSRAQFDAAAQKMAQLLSGWRLIVLPVALLAVLRITLASRFPTTHALTDDWYSHANYFTLFLLGALLAQQPKFWQAVDAQRWISLALALLCWALIIIFMAWPDAAVTPEQLRYWQPLMRIAYVCCEWSAILAVCGFAHRHLQTDSPARRYLTQAVFPLYILHQTLIVVVAHALKPALIPAPVEAVVIIIITFTTSFGIFEIVRRVPLLQPLFGIGRLDMKRDVFATAKGEGVLAR
jgi:glucan biosynthesis protein C